MDKLPVCVQTQMDKLPVCVQTQMDKLPVFLQTQMDKLPVCVQTHHSHDVALIQMWQFFAKYTCRGNAALEQCDYVINLTNTKTLFTSYIPAEFYNLSPDALRALSTNLLIQHYDVDAGY